MKKQKSTCLMYKYIFVLPIISSFLPGIIEFLLLIKIHDGFYLNSWDLVFVIILITFIIYKVVSRQVRVNLFLFYGIITLFVLISNSLLTGIEKLYYLQIVSALLYACPILYFSQIKTNDLKFVNKIIIFIIVYLSVHNIIFSFAIPVLGKLYFPTLLTLKTAYKYDDWWNGYIVRIASPAGSAVATGYVICMVTYSYVLIQKKISKHINSIIILLSFICVLTTLSRAAIVLWVLLFFLHIFKISMLKEKSFFLISIITIIIVTIIGVPQAIISRLSNEAVSSNKSRIEKYENLINKINQVGLTGHGYMTGEDRSEDRYYSFLKKDISDKNKKYKYKIETSENLFLLYTYEIGVVNTIIVFFMLVLIALYKDIKKYRNALLGVTYVYIFMLLFDSTIISIKYSIFVFLYIYILIYQKNDNIKPVCDK